ncbi:MAG TPA: hypothetical protein VFW28_05365 [Micropepsaceae bacterium]|nr:hypothetical protein [Micropepsaceae bacterium]
MPTLISGSKLKQAVEQSTFIKNGAPSSAEAVKYDFHMGSRVLKAEFGQPVEIDSIPQEKRWVLPGEVAFVLTRERLELPRNVIAALSPKRKLAHSGIIVLGGLSIDPEYCGVLLVGLYNFSSTPFPLRPGKKLIAAVFYELAESELVDFPVASPTEITDFPDELVTLIRNYRPIELAGIQEELKDARREITALRNEFMTDKTWKDEFKNGLDQHNRQLGTLIDGLKEERDARKQEDKDIRDKLDKMSTFFLGGRWVIGAVLFIVGVAITIIGEHYLR